MHGNDDDDTVLKAELAVHHHPCIIINNQHRCLHTTVITPRLRHILPRAVNVHIRQLNIYVLHVVITNMPRKCNVIAYLPTANQN